MYMLFLQADNASAQSFMAMLPMMGPLLAALGAPTSMAELQQKLGSKDASRCAA
jgi:hypothetical protein